MSQRRSALRLIASARHPRRGVAVKVYDHTPAIIKRHIDNLQILVLENEDLARAVLNATETWARGRATKKRAHGG